VPGKFAGPGTFTAEQYGKTAMLAEVHFPCRVDAGGAKKAGHLDEPRIPLE